MSKTDTKKLLSFVTDLAGEKFLKVEKEIGSGYFVLKISEAERRQAKHDIRSVEDIIVEMVRNSRDAGANQIFIATNKDSAKRREIIVVDDGEGIPEEYHEKIFEPRVTSKIDSVVEDRFGLHGRGMALYSIRLNTSEAKVISSTRDTGSVFRVSVNTRILGERKDQSSLPKIKMSGDKLQVLSGPHNILRHLIEMNLESPNLEIFYGSGSEVLATFAFFSKNEEKTRRGSNWLASTALDDPDSLKEFAKDEFGLSISVRNCQRIIAGEIKPLLSIQDRVIKSQAKRPNVKLSKKAMAKMIDDKDVEIFAQEIEEKFRTLGEKYFLKLEEKPKIVFSGSTLRIDLNVVSEDTW